MEFTFHNSCLNLELVPTIAKLLTKTRGRRNRDHMVVQSVPITTNVVDSNPVHGKL